MNDNFVFLSAKVQIIKYVLLIRKGIEIELFEQQLSYYLYLMTASPFRICSTQLYILERETISTINENILVDLTHRLVNSRDIF